MAIIAPDVLPQPIPDVRVQPATSAETFGGGQGLAAEGQEVQKIASSIGDIAAFEKIRADQTAVEEAQAKGTQLSLDVLYNPQTGVLGSKGEDALQSQKDGMTRLQKGMNEISLGLNGDQQKGAFNKWSLSHVGDADRAMMGHVDAQLKDHDTDKHDALVAGMAATVAMAHGDPQTIKNSFSTVNENTDNYAKRMRLDPDGAAQLKQNVNDTMHSSVIDGLQKFQPGPSAQIYFDQHKDEISPKQQEKIQEALQEGNARYQAQSSAQSIIKKNPDSESDSLKETESISDPDQRDMARKFISQKFSQDRQAVRNDQDAAFTQMGQMIDKKGLTDPVAIRNAVPPMKWNSLRPEQQAALERRGGEAVTSISKWTDFKEAVKDGSVTKMSRSDLETKYLPYMSPADQKAVVDQWSSAQKGAANPKFVDTQTTAQSIDTSLSTAGVIHASTKDRGNADSLVLKQVEDGVHRDFIASEVSLGRSLKPEEKQAIIDKHVIDAVGAKTSFLSRSGPTPYENIPEVAKEQAVQLARSVGGTATREKVEQAYALHRQGKSDDEVKKIFK